MAYTTIDDPTIYFNTLLWTGNGSDNRVISGVGFQPDWIWWKHRSGTNGHGVIDVVRGTSGTNYTLATNSTSAEFDWSSIFKNIQSDGYTVGTDSAINQSGQTYVAWNWLADNTSGSSNTDGSITSTVSANTTAGFSIVSYTGTGSTGTIGHGLGTTPAMGIFKNRSAGSKHWRVWHQNLDNDKILELSDTTVAHTPGTADFNISNNSSTVWGLSTNSQSNGSGNSMIAYLFAEKKGYSKFGSYTGNGNSDGTFVYTGFKPAFLIIKKTSAAGSWYIYDNKRAGGSNVNDDAVLADTTDSEFSSNIDFTAQGVKIRTSGSGENLSGGSFIFMAFAESPFVNSNGVPNNAR